MPETVEIDKRDAPLLIDLLERAARNRQGTGFCTCEGCRYKLDLAAALADPNYRRAFTPLDIGAWRVIR